MKTLLGALLVLSVALNAVLWSRLCSQESQLISAQATASENEDLRRQLQELKTHRPRAVVSAAADPRELARLRNETGLLRQQAEESAGWRAQAAETAVLRARLATATQDLARAEEELGHALNLSPEELGRLKQEAEDARCVSNLKQIGLAARLWAGDHNHMFPPDFLAMKQEIYTPEVLSCPADPAAIRVKEWSQLSASSISYRLLSPNGNLNSPIHPLTACPIHGHTGLSDGSAHRNAKPPDGASTAP